MGTDVPGRPGPCWEGGLTRAELNALALTAQLTAALGEVVGHARTRAADLGELLAHVHVIQQAVMSQAAARAHPDRFRLLGGVVGDLSAEIAGAALPAYDPDPSIVVCARHNGTDCQRCGIGWPVVP